MTTAAPDRMQPGNCHYCGQYHPQTICPFATAVEYYPDGQVKRVEFGPQYLGVGHPSPHQEKDDGAEPDHP